MIHNDEPLNLSALVLANDSDAVPVRAVLASHGYEVVDVENSSAAMELCKHQRFDLAVCDDDISGAMGITMNSWSRPRVTIGLLPAINRRTAARLQFVLRKPVNTELFAKTVKAALAPIAADRRLTMRKKVYIKAAECTVNLGSDRRPIASVTIANLSSTGVCLQAPEILPRNATVELQFALPGRDSHVRLVGQVIWARDSGQCGVRFSKLDSSEQGKLEAWLDAVLTILPLVQSADERLYEQVVGTLPASGDSIASQDGISGIKRPEASYGDDDEYSRE
jgi:PilZ domain